MARRPYQWERDFAAAAGRPAPTNPAYERLVAAAFERYENDRFSLKGWKEIAGFMIWDERNARSAYAEWPAFRKCVIKRGGRYYADPAELMNLRHEFLCRREGRSDETARSGLARNRRRGKSGAFA